MAVKQKRKKRHKRERGRCENGAAMRACSEETARPTGQQTILDGNCVVENGSIKLKNYLYWIQNNKVPEMGAFSLE